MKVNSGHFTQDVSTALLSCGVYYMDVIGTRSFWQATWNLVSSQNYECIQFAGLKVNLGISPWQQILFGDTFYRGLLQAILAIEGIVASQG